MTTVLPRAFYSRPTLAVLEDLIGKVLVHEVRGRRVSGVIVEAEAYIGEDDPACHAAPGPTKRNAPLYGPPGRAYVYFNYGMHYLVNAVTEAEGSPAAVLIRALEPRDGQDLMRRRRARVSGRPASSIPTADLCRGPANLTASLGIDLAQNQLDLTTSRLTIEDAGVRPARLAWSPRVGIRVGVEKEWRCSWAGHPSVSGPRPR
jgi:DNA-3-methyladenine glycosylase